MLSGFERHKHFEGELFVQDDSGQEISAHFYKLHAKVYRIINKRKIKNPINQARLFNELEVFGHIQ